MRYLLLAAFLLAVSTACTQPTPPPKTAAYYFQEGERLLEKKRYDEAIEAWEQVRQAYKSPELTALAEMKIAETHFVAEHFLEAAMAYDGFLKQHPNHPQTSQIIYKLGMSYYNQILSHDRDQTPTRNALAAFTDLTKKYPDSPLTIKVAPLMRECRHHLAAREVYVGRFYLRTKSFEAAISRLKDIPDLFPDYPENDRAYYYLGQAYFKDGNLEETVNAFNTLAHKFPDSKYIELAQRFLEKQEKP